MTAPPQGEAIRDMVEKMLEDPSVGKIPVDAPLQGVIDSFALIELLGLLEKRHGIKFQNADMAKENWKSFSAIGRLVDSMTGQGRAGGGSDRP